MELLTIQELMAIFKVDRSTIFRWDKAGRLPKKIKIGKAVRWRKDEIEKMIKDHQEK